MSGVDVIPGIVSTLCSGVVAGVLGMFALPFLGAVLMRGSWSSGVLPTFHPYERCPKFNRTWLNLNLESSYQCRKLGRRSNSRGDRSRNGITNGKDPSIIFSIIIF